MKPNLKPPLLLFTLLLSLFAAQLFGQNTNKINKNTKEKPTYRYVLKGYLSYFQEQKQILTIDHFGRQYYDFEKSAHVLPMFGFSKLRANGSFYEMSLTQLNLAKQDVFILRGIRDTFNGSLISTPLQGAKSHLAHIGTRFEWNFPIFKEYMDNIQPFIGGSIDPSVLFKDITPYTIAAFPTRIFEVCNSFSIIPRAVISLSEHWLLDIHLPFSVFTTAYSYNYEGNPILPTYARSTSRFENKFSPNIWSIRLGVGYRI
ncbi:MAG: hypothetical protein JNL70_00725 [Saprospiraceae bacterium]|nr:hypothetical protein [Saprospiraceae bacterium]